MQQGIIAGFGTGVFDPVGMKRRRGPRTTASAQVALSEWLNSEGRSHVVMEATGVYWTPVWHTLSGDDVALTVANTARQKRAG